MRPRHNAAPVGTVRPMSTRKQSTNLADILAGELENKDLSGSVTPAEAEEPQESPVADEVAVRMIHHYTYQDSNLLPGQEIRLPAALAHKLITGHFAAAI